MAYDHRKACEELLEQRYRFPEDFPDNPIPRYVKIDGGYCTNPEWINAPYTSKLIWDEDLSDTD